MATLTNRQINALVDKIIYSIENPIIQHNKKIEDSESYKNFIHKNRDCKKIIEIGKKWGLEEDSWLIQDFCEHIRDVAFKQHFIPIPPLHRKMIENDIIIETMDGIYSESIINKLIEKHK